MAVVLTKYENERAVRGSFCLTPHFFFEQKIPTSKFTIRIATDTAILKADSQLD